MRASPFDVKRKTRRQSDSAEPSGRRIAMRKGRPNITPEEDPNAKDLEAVENAIKDTMGESNTTSDESHDPVQKRKRKLDTLGEYLQPYFVSSRYLSSVILQLYLLRHHQSGQISVKDVWDSLAEVALGRTRSSYRAT